MGFSAVESLEPLKLCEPLIESHKRSAAYRPAPGLAEALDVAMMLGVPLLLSGDPGVGKTRAAHWLAENELRTPLLRFDVKSNTLGSDLLYHFDEVSRFRDSSRPGDRPMVEYLRFNALGKAIVESAGGRASLFTLSGEKLVGEELLRRRKPLVEAFGEAAEDLFRRAEAGEGEVAATVSLLLPEAHDFRAAAPRHRVVLIDELDKAPRDTPNDLLVEVEDMEFNIPELGVKVRGDPGYRPIVIITTNSEKSLPDPFLRRCAFFDIPFPEEDDLKEIIDGSIQTLKGGGTLVTEALDAFLRFRAPQALTKAPGTAELLAWLDVLLRRGLRPGDSLREACRDPERRIGTTLTAVMKTTADQKKGRRMIQDWARKSAD
ncbi:MAG TPA: MoxR family ATPase [Allosphingosinicella sp.]|jgi:MoxR-like ATPase